MGGLQMAQGASDWSKPSKFSLVFSVPSLTLIVVTTFATVLNMMLGTMEKLICNDYGRGFGVHVFFCGSCGGSMDDATPVHLKSVRRSS